MTSENPFRIAVVVVMVLTVAVTAYHRLQAASSGEKISRKDEGYLFAVVLRLLAETDINPVRTAGIGDTMGDRFIAERVAWFGCPANAEAEIKKSAAYVSPHPEVEGVLDILKRLSL